MRENFGLKKWISTKKVEATQIKMMSLYKVLYCFLHLFRLVFNYRQNEPDIFHVVFSA